MFAGNLNTKGVFKNFQESHLYFMLMLFSVFSRYISQYPNVKFLMNISAVNIKNMAFVIGVLIRELVTMYS